MVKIVEDRPEYFVQVAEAYSHAKFLESCGHSTHNEECLIALKKFIDAIKLELAWLDNDFDDVHADSDVALTIQKLFRQKGIL
jgi:hypothetical protein